MQIESYFQKSETFTVNQSFRNIYYVQPVIDTNLTLDKVGCDRCGHILLGSIHNKCI